MISAAYNVDFFLKDPTAKFWLSVIQLKLLKYLIHIKIFNTTVNPAHIFLMENPQPGNAKNDKNCPN
jgi:hypothetical protein